MSLLRPCLLVSLLLICSTLSFAQKVSVNMQNTTVLRVLKSLSRQTGYSLAYSKEVVNLNRTVTIQMADVDLTAVLDKIVEKTDLAYSIDDRKIYLFKREVPVPKEKTVVNHPQEKAQPSFPVHGVVRDVRGDSIPGVSIYEKGTANGTYSNLEGNYSFPSSSPQSVLVFSCMGYVDQEVPVNGQAQINVMLRENAEILEEVVVVGYGVQKKVTSVGSITQTAGEELLKVGAVNSVSEALQGKLNGVVAINSTGRPGENAVEMYIRGKSTWGTTDPLILVDGVQRKFDDIDLNEIQTISVLKDASATAVYGVRGGNGVILITTKRGTADAPKVSFTATVRNKRPTNRMYYDNHLNAMEGYNRAMANDRSWDKLIPQSTFDAWERAYREDLVGPYSDYFPYVNMWDEMIGSGWTQNYNANIRGGSENMRYFASIGYQDDGEIYKTQKSENLDPRNWFKRYNWRSNFDFDLTNTTKLSVSIGGSMSYRNSSLSDVYTRILSEATSDHPIKYSDGEWGDDEEKAPYPNMNLVAQDTKKRFQGYYDAGIEQKLDFITEGLKAAAKISYTSYSATVTTNRRGGSSENNAMKAIVRYHRVFDYSNPILNDDGTIDYPMIENRRLPQDETVNLPVSNVNRDVLDAFLRTLYYEFSLSWNRNIKGHEMSALALMNREISDGKSGSTVKFPSYYENWVGRVTYNWKERYLAEFNISYTGSEKFARGHRFGLFPSYSVGWRVTEEPWIKESSVSKVLNNLKIRYSWGKVGSDAGAERWNYVQTYSSSGSLTLGDTQSHSWGPLYAEGPIANVNATWEKSVKQNLGIEFTLFHKLSGTLDLFDEQRKDILMAPQTTSSIAGASFNAMNLGRTKNHGLELELEWADKIGQYFNYFTRFTWATSENRVVFRDDPRNTMNHLKQEGKPIGHQLRYIVVGNYETIDDIMNYAQSGSINSVTPVDVVPGDFVYVDFDADGILNDQDQVAVRELNYPLHIYGLTLGFNWKGLSFSTMFYAPTGVYKTLYSGFYASFVDGKVNGQPGLLQSWTPATANTSGIQAPSLHLDNKGKFNGTENTWRYQDFSYLRLKNVELCYKFNKKVCRSLKMTSLQVFVNGNNLLTCWGGDKRVDPEGAQSSYPMLKSVTSGLRVSF